MATFYYSPNQNPPAPPAYILKASAATSADSKWYDPNRTWGEWFGWSKKPTHPTGPTLPSQSDNLPYDHAFPFGVDPNDPSKPYAPYGFYCDENGNPTTVPYIQWREVGALQYGLDRHSDASDPASPLNVYNVDSPMDPYNMQQFFYAEKPGSPFHQYERQPDQDAPWDEVTITGEGDYEYTYWEQKPLPGYINYSDQQGITFKDTPENFPWLHDQDPTHHYRNGNGMQFLSTCVQFFGPDQPQINITEKVWLDSPVAPAGWQEVQQPTTPAQ